MLCAFNFNCLPRMPCLVCSSSKNNSISLEDNEWAGFELCFLKDAHIGLIKRKNYASCPFAVSKRLLWISEEKDARNIMNTFFCFLFFHSPSLSLSQAKFWRRKHSHSQRFGADDILDKSSSHKTLSCFKEEAFKIQRFEVKY